MSTKPADKEDPQERERLKKDVRYYMTKEDSSFLSSFPDNLLNMPIHRLIVLSLAMICLAAIVCG